MRYCRCANIISAVALLWSPSHASSLSAPIMDGPGVLELRTALYTELSSSSQCIEDLSFRDVITPPDASLTSASHLAAEISQLFELLERSVVNHLMRNKKRTSKVAYACIGAVSRVLLQHREVSSRLEYFARTGLSLAILWDTVFGDLYEYLDSNDRHEGVTTMEDCRAWLGSLMHRERLHPTIVDVLIRRNRTAKTSITSSYFQSSVFGYVALHFVILRDGNCARLDHLVPLLRNVLTRTEDGQALYEPLVHFCPQLFDAPTQQDILTNWNRTRPSFR